MGISGACFKPSTGVVNVWNGWEPLHRARSYLDSSWAYRPCVVDSSIVQLLDILVITVARLARVLRMQQLGINYGFDAQAGTICLCA